MADEKFSKLENAAIMRKRSIFLNDLKNALSPVFVKHFPYSENTGDPIYFSAEAAGKVATVYLSMTDRVAVEELSAKLGYLTELMADKLESDS